jgi:hypothetical protein
MHKFFADWHKEANIDPRGLDLEGRWDCAADYSAQTSLRGLVDLVFLAYQDPADGVDEPLRDRLKNFDQAFSMRGNDNEVALLAAAGLISVLQQDDELKTAIIAYASSSASFQGSEPIIADLLLERDQAISRMSALRRRYSLKSSLRQSKPSQELTEAKTLVQQMADQTIPIDHRYVSAFRKIEEYQDQRIAAAVSAIDSLMRQAQTMVSSLSEETNILWWLFGGRSTLLDLPFAEIPVGVRSVVLAVELADLSHTPCPPVSLSALLSRAIGSDQVVVDDVVDAIRGHNLLKVEDSDRRLAPLWTDIAERQATQRTCSSLELASAAYAEARLLALISSGR